MTNISQLIPIVAKSIADAETLNANFQFLDSKIKDIDMSGLEKAVNKNQPNGYCGLDSEGKISSDIMTKSTSDIQQNIDSINSSISTINNQISTISSFVYKKSEKTDIGIGKTNLKTYLPNDGKDYLVWLQAKMESKGSGAEIWEKVVTDRMTTAHTYIQCDGDSGDSSRVSVLTVVPVGPGRYIKISKGSTDPSSASRRLCGYCRI